MLLFYCVLHNFTWSNIVLIISVYNCNVNSHKIERKDIEIYGVDPNWTCVFSDNMWTSLIFCKILCTHLENHFF